jgi:hypothetical protein
MKGFTANPGGRPSVTALRARYSRRLKERRAILSMLSKAMPSLVNVKDVEHPKFLTVRRLSSGAAPLFTLEGGSFQATDPLVPCGLA